MSAVPVSGPKTIEDLFALEESVALRFELVDGELVELPVSNKSSRTNALFGHFLVSYALATGAGDVFDSEMTYELMKSVRRADASFFLSERSPVEEISRFVGAPDVVVEVVSPSDKWNDIRNKVQEWLDNGARLVWLATPSAREVMIFRRGQRPRTVGAGDVLEGEDVLPGFSVEVDQLFPVPSESRQQMSGS